jgi:D-3-phosphoglycerate dehydrogenase
MAPNAASISKRNDRDTRMAMPNVLISDALSSAAVQIFKDRGIEVDFQPNLGKDKDKLAEIIGNYDGLAIRSATKVSPKILEKAKRLKVIGRAGIGVDNVDIPAATARGVIVMNTPFGNSITTAEHAISLMLALARQIPEADTSTRAGKWEKNKFMGVEIFGKTLGVIGCGNIGSIVADRAVGLKMKVIAYDPFLSAERAMDLASRRSSLKTCSSAPISSRCTRRSPTRPRTSSTRGAEEDEKGRAHHQLRPRRPGRRGGAVRRARKRPRRGAAFDVFVEEPATSNPLFACPTWCARRISAPPRAKRRKTSRCRSPSRCRTICCAARSPTR